MSGPVISYKIPSYITLDEIAHATYTTVDELKNLNSILRSTPESKIAGLTINIQQTYIGAPIDGSPTQMFPVQNTHQLSEEELRQNLAFLQGFSDRRERHAILTSTQAQRKEDNAVCTTSQCAQEYVDLLHISEQKGNSIEHKFVPLTQQESDEFYEEEQMIKDLIGEFYAGLDAIQGTDTKVINQTKQQLFQRMIEGVKDKEKYGDLFERCSVKRDAEGNRTPQGNANPDPTQVIEERRLFATPSSLTAEPSPVVTIGDPPTLVGSRNANTTYTRDQILALNYVRGRRFKDLIQTRYYQVPPARSAPWWNSQTRSLDTKKLLDEIKKLGNTPFSKKLEIKLEGTHEFINHSTYSWKDNTDWPLPGIHANINVSREAQVLRLASNGAASAGWDTSKKAFVLALKTSAQVDFISAEATTKATWPADELAHVTYQYGRAEQDIIDFGCFHFNIEIKINGFAGASGMIGADIQVDMSSGRPQLKGSSDFPGSIPGAQVGVEAFVGVKAGCDVKGGVEWKDMMLSTQEWKPLAEVGMGAQAYFGGGLEGKLYISFKDGTFFLRVKAGAAWGVGASGEIAGAVNVNNIGTMAHFVYNSLLKVDFRRVDWLISTEGFWQLSLIGLALVAQGFDWTISRIQQVWESVQKTWDNISNLIERLFSDWDEGRSALLGRHISADVRKKALSVVLHLPPEGKGQLLWKLTYTNALNRSKRLSKDAIDGIFDLLGACQGPEEYSLTYACMNENGTLAPHETRDAVIQQNKRRVAEFIAKSHRSNESIDYSYLHRQISYEQEVTLNIKTLDSLIALDAAPMPDCPVQFNRCVMPTQLAMLKGSRDFDHYA